MITMEQKEQNYRRQNRGRPFTIRQKRQLRKTEVRQGHLTNRQVHRETKRNRRQRFREWMAGIR
jgi:hypothetical protein